MANSFSVKFKVALLCHSGLFVLAWAVYTVFYFLFCFIDGSFLTYWPVGEGNKPLRACIMLWHLLFQVVGSLALYSKENSYKPSFFELIMEEYNEYSRTKSVKPDSTEEQK